MSAPKKIKLGHVKTSNVGKADARAPTLMCGDRWFSERSSRLVSVTT